MVEQHDDRLATLEIAARKAPVPREFVHASDNWSRDAPGDEGALDDNPTAPFTSFERELAMTDPLAEARPFALPSFDSELDESPSNDILPSSRGDVEVQVELGRALLPLGDDESLRAGTVIPLDKLAADPVDVVVEGRLIARGEVLVVNEKLCIRIAEVPGSMSPFETPFEDGFRSI